MSRVTILSAGLLSAAVLCACDGRTHGDDGITHPDASEAGSDAGEADAQVSDGGVMNVEIGTGVEAFEALTEGEMIPIQLGPQGGGQYGGFHVWHAVRVHDLDPTDITLNFRVYLASTNEEIASQERRADLLPSSGGWIAYGIAPPFTDCCLAEDHDIVMTVLVTDSTGKTGSDRRTVHAELCKDFSGVSVCP